MKLAILERIACALERIAKAAERANPPTQAERFEALIRNERIEATTQPADDIGSEHEQEEDEP
jgi:hypothetical protein